MKISMMRKKVAGLLIVTLLGLTSIFLFDPVSQDPSYHQFADSRMILGVTNFFNVFTKVPFLLIGVLRHYRLNHVDVGRNVIVVCGVLYLGIVLIGFCTIG